MFDAPKPVDILKLTEPELERYLSLRGVDLCRFQGIVRAASRDPEIISKLSSPNHVAKFLEQNSFGGLNNTVDKVYENVLRGQYISDLCADDMYPYQTIPALKKEDPKKML